MSADHLSHVWFKVTDLEVAVGRGIVGDDHIR